MSKQTKPVCVGRYLVDVPAAAEVELSGGMIDGFEVMRLALPGHADLGLTLFSIGGATPGPGLLERAAKTKTGMGANILLRMTTLRSGKRSINGVDGEELLVRAREYNFTTTYGFNWEAPGTKDDPMRPFPSLELRNGLGGRSGGKPVDTSLNEDALLAIWDRIAASIRVRKTVARPPSGLRWTAAKREAPQLGAH